MAWDGILCTKFASEKPAQPPKGIFPPDGWTIGKLVPVVGQDEGKRLWGVMLIADTDVTDDYAFDTTLAWTAVQELD